MTLIEVVAALVILGTVLASLVVARARYLHQWALATRRQEAVMIANSLLSAWWGQSAQLPQHAGGELPDRHLRWQTRTVDDAPIASLGVVTIRLEVFEDGEQAVTNPAQPLVAVDVVANGPQPAVTGSQP
jgi:type II secretory pathway pseudopilin PulG